MAAGRIPINPATADLKLPFDNVTDSAAERHMTDVAQNRLTTRCMARYGITYARQDPAPATGTEDPHLYPESVTVGRGATRTTASRTWHCSSLNGWVSRA